MRKHILSLILIITLFTVLSAKELQKFVIRLENPSKKDISYFSEKKYDIASFKKHKYLDLVVLKKNTIFSPKKVTILK